RVLKNRATSDKNVISHNDCEKCDDPLLFAMQDKTHQFSIGLFTILKCLKIAEKEGALPRLPPDWWWSLENRYHLNLYLIE
ncbi:MAG: XRE family transcriptional regulator, partial [Candidatus Adiutrix sp.]